MKRKNGNLSHRSYLVNYALIIFLIGIGKITFASNLSIVPLALPTSIPLGDVSKAYYVVSNTTSRILKNNHIENLPPNVSQIIDNNAYGRITCGKYFDLSPSSSCILELNVFGPVDSKDPEPKNHLQICGETIEACIRIEDQTNELNVTEGKNNLSRLAIVQEYKDESLSSSRPIAYTSTDGGISWSSNIIADGGTFIRAITCGGASGKSCMAVGDQYEVSNKTSFVAYSSKDNGVNWTKHIINTYSAVSGLTAVTCRGNDGDECIAVGGYTPLSKKFVAATPVIYKTYNHGATWTPYFPPMPSGYNEHSVLTTIWCNKKTGQNCLAVGYISHAGAPKTTLVSYSSTDGGINWVPKIINQQESRSIINSISCRENDGLKCIAVGTTNMSPGAAQPLIYSTSNGGDDWSDHILQEDVNGTINSMACDKDNISCIAVGSAYYSKTSYPIAYKTIDGGVTWNINYQDQNSSHRTAFHSITCNENLIDCTIIGVGRSYIPGSQQERLPYLYRSIDGGRRWLHRAAPGFITSGQFADITFLPRNIVGTVNLLVSGNK